MFNNANIPDILNFGFLGLSLLLVFLGWRLTTKVVSDSNATPDKIDIAKYFLRVALLFMVFAGPLQWATVGITTYFNNKPIVLHVGAANPSWKDDFGEVYISEKNGQLIPISKKMISVSISNNDQIRIELSNVMDVIRDMKQTIISLNSQRLKDKPETRAALEGG